MRVKGRFTPWEDTKLTELWNRGISDTVISEVIGRHRGVIRRRADQLGLKPLTVVRYERSMADINSGREQNDKEN